MADGPLSRKLANCLSAQTGGHPFLYSSFSSWGGIARHPGGFPRTRKTKTPGRGKSPPGRHPGNPGNGLGQKTVQAPASETMYSLAVRTTHFLTGLIQKCALVCRLRVMNYSLATATSVICCQIFRFRSLSFSGIEAEAK